MDHPDPIVAQVTVPLAPAEAFRAFTDQMGRWWDPALTPDPATFTGVEIDPVGEVAMRHGEDRYVWGAVTTWEPGVRYAQSFWLGHRADRPTTLTATFTGVEHGTEVRLEHGGWTAATAEARAKYDHWPDLLARYAAHAAR